MDPARDNGQKLNQKKKYLLWCGPLNPSMFRRAVMVLLDHLVLPLLNNVIVATDGRRVIVWSLSLEERRWVNLLGNRSTGVDPRFPSTGRGRYSQNLPKNSVKMKEFEPRKRMRVPSTPPWIRYCLRVTMHIWYNKECSRVISTNTRMHSSKLLTAHLLNDGGWSFTEPRSLHGNNLHRTLFIEPHSWHPLLRTAPAANPPVDRYTGVNTLQTLFAGGNKKKGTSTSMSSQKGIMSSKFFVTFF